ncbi:hypothetical protein [Crocosphaera sp.]|uniref:hypothetical protein n=1 Tax=Crocosphaera sp. TaxID=2729996 RepID=UPI003F1EE512|nr:hypothetical protein [Crocosphaera sp.]
MNEKLSQHLSQIDITDLIEESVENALSRRQQGLDLEDDLLEVSNDNARILKGGFHTCGMVGCDDPLKDILKIPTP